MHLKLFLIKSNIMKNLNILILIFIPIIFTLVNSALSSEPNYSVTNSKQTGAFYSGKYRNLFVELLGKSQTEVRAKIDDAWKQLFYGDNDTQRVYYPVEPNMAYIKDIGNNDVRSEGMSYGMMIAVQMNKKAEFDALWTWARKYMYHDSPSHPGYGYFSWSMKTDGTANDEMPAPDGEEYFAMSLYFATGRWGNCTGIYDYKSAADRLLTDMVHREVITGQTCHGKRTGREMFSEEHAMVRFTPNTNFTDPSYHLPAFYELWARWGPVEDRPFWIKVAMTSRDFFQKVTHPITALAPDYANFDGTTRGLWRARFQYDAWRTAMNWSVDWAWWTKDVRERQLSDKLQAFFESKGISTHGNRFTLDGKQFSDDHSPGLVAMNAVASLTATHPRAQKFVEELWNTPIPSGQWRYYDGMLYMMAMLHLSGNFRIYEPSGKMISTH
jgi:oligosaccharide reducing-end xylanase